MSEEKHPSGRKPNGDFAPGNQFARLAKGVPKTRNRVLEKERKEMAKEVTEQAQDLATTMLNGKLGDVLDQLYGKAMEGDVKAMALWLRHSTPVAPQAPKLIDSELLAEFQNESPETIIQLTTRAMASGQCDVLMGKQLIDACKASIDAAFSQKFKSIVKRMQRDNLGIQEVLPDLMRLADDIGPTLLEHEE